MLTLWIIFLSIFLRIAIGAPATGVLEESASLPLQKREDLECDTPYRKAFVFQDCLAAVSEMPSSYDNVDWHQTTGYPRRVFFDTVLTTIGNPNAQNHLPRTFIRNNCRITCSLVPGVTTTRVLWEDVKLRAQTLVNHCVGGWRPLGTGMGYSGTFTYDRVIIRVDSIVAAVSGEVQTS